MKKLIWLAILLPTFANAQWVNGVIQRNGSNGSVRYFQGANIDTLAKKSDLIPGLQDSLTKKANRTFDNVASGAIAKSKVDTTATGLQTVSNLFPKGDTRYQRTSERTTVGNSFYTLTNPSAITFPRINADNTVSALSASDFRTAIGAGTSSTTGTVTSVAATVPTGLTISGSPITTSGTLAIGLQSGYSIPTTAKQGQWDTAYSWGNPSGVYLPLTGGTLTGDLTGTRGIFSTSSTSPVTVNSTGAGVYMPFSVSGSEIGSIGSAAGIFPGNSNDYIGLRGATGKGLQLGSNGFARMTMDVSGNTSWTGMASFGGRVAVTSSAANGARVWVNQAYNAGASSFGYDFYRTYDTGGGGQLAGFIRVVRAGGDDNTGLSFAVANQGTSPTAQMTLAPSGTLSLTSLSGSGNVITGANNNGELGKITIGSGLSLSSGVLTATGGSSGTVTTPGGTSGKLAMFNSASDIGDSNLTQSGSEITLQASSHAFFNVTGSSSGNIKLIDEGYTADLKTSLLRSNDGLTQLITLNDDNSTRNIALSVNHATSLVSVGSGGLSVNGNIAAVGDVTGANLNISNWNTAYSQTRQWDGGSTGLNAATGRTSLGGTTVGQNLFTLTNPSAITFPRINADNTVSALSASDFRTAIGAGTSSTTGTVTSVSAGNGLNFTTITGSGSVTLGTPGSVTLASTNSVTTNSHTHAFEPGGTSSQYIRGNGTIANFPTIPAGTVTSVGISGSNGIGVSSSPITSSGTIGLSLGAITPTSVAASGTVTGSNLSGTNTGDQTNITGNAGTATKLATARTIAGVSFDGTANISLNNNAITNGAGYITSSALSPYAPIASPALTGDPTAPTQTQGDNSTKIATTAYVDEAVSSGSGTSGTYTPTITNGTNVSSSTAQKAQWIRVGNNVTIFGKISITTGAGTTTNFKISLPSGLSSNFTNSNQSNGFGTTSWLALDNSLKIENYYVSADITGDIIEFSGISIDSRSRTIWYSLTYEIL